MGKQQKVKNSASRRWEGTRERRNDMKRREKQINGMFESGRRERMDSEKEMRKLWAFS